MASRLLSCLACLLLVLSAAPARGQDGSGAQSIFLDPSIATYGMGKAGAAVFWSDAPNDWSNPALLGFHRGARYLHTRNQLIPDVADDVYFISKRLAIGGGGIGVSMAGKPFESIGEMRLDYGQSVATDGDGNEVGTFNSFEVIRQLGVGVNVLEALENTLRLLGKDPSSLSRRIDLSVGHAWKSIEVDLAPAWATLDGRAVRGEATERDRGALLRVTPLDHIDGGTSVGGTRWRVDAAVGFSQRNYTDHRIFFIDEDQWDPLTEERIVGLATRVTADLPGEPRGLTRDFLASRIAAGATIEEVRYYDDGRRTGGTIRRAGLEIVLAELLSLRYGHIDDPTGTVEGHTWGVGVQVRYRRAIGARYDFASVPQSRFLDRVERKGVTVFVDPYAVWKGLR